MKRLRKQICMIISVLGMLFLFANCQITEAKKYYSLRDIGLSGCTTDSVDYGILSIRGNKVKYIQYKISSNGYTWEKVGNVQTAKLTSATKYYVGDASKVSNSLKKQGDTEAYLETLEVLQRSNGRRRYITPKNINTEKWIYRVRKGTLKKYLSGRNNEIRIVKGKVTKIVVRLSY